jgi:hypoxanthine-DNA glycosylase
MSAIEGFSPIASGNSSILILGTMPSETSLRKQEYYGHSRNAFWSIMSLLHGFNHELDYQGRKEMLMENGVAVWDVLQSCKRLGSLDANIKQSTIVTNDFACFFSENKGINRVFFNGKMAEKVYQNKVLLTLNNRFTHLEYQCLPSTSPANATLNLEQKILSWKVIKQSVVK